MDYEKGQVKSGHKLYDPISNGHLCILNRPVGPWKTKGASWRLLFDEKRGLPRCLLRSDRMHLTGALLEKLRHQESQLDRLIGVEARIAMRVVAVLQLVVADGAG